MLPRQRDDHRYRRGRGRALHLAHVAHGSLFRCSAAGLAHVSDLLIHCRPSACLWFSPLTPGLKPKTGLEHQESSRSLDREPLLVGYRQSLPLPSHQRARGSVSRSVVLGIGDCMLSKARGEAPKLWLLTKVCTSSSRQHTLQRAHGQHDPMIVIDVSHPDSNARTVKGESQSCDHHAIRSTSSERRRTSCAAMRYTRPAPS